MTNGFKEKALYWASQMPVCCFLDSNGYTDKHGTYDWILAAGAQHTAAFGTDHFKDLQNFHDLHKTHIFGFLGYDLKNELEDLSSDNPDHLNFPDAYFFVPTYLVACKNGKISILINATGQDILREIEIQQVQYDQTNSLEVRPRITKEEYLKRLASLKKHIVRGDIYEATFCQEFYAENAIIDPITTYFELTGNSPTPFASFFKLDDKFIISASPERFLSKRGDHITSQPIKGTRRRLEDSDLDAAERLLLRNDAKEQAENIMIVDLVRHDLTKIAKKGTVKVEELFGIYSFKNIHQMISTVSCTLADTITFSEAIKNCFPMGSMTGAPKIRAMELIDSHEAAKRGVYSGTIGWISPEADFDLNVVIRTVLYNSASGYISFHVGGAITHGSIPENEYEECLLKAQAMLNVLRKT